MIIILLALFIFLLLASILIGLKVRQFISIEQFNSVYAFPIGFFIILGVYQLIAWPFMLLHLSTSILVGLTAVMLIVLIVLLIKEWRLLYDHIKKFLVKNDSWLIVSCFIFLSFLYTIFRSLDTYWDFNFYIPLIGTNVESDFLNVVDPWSGRMDNLSWMYNYQGYYVMMAMLSKLFNIDSTLLMIWVPSLLSFLILPCVILDSLKLLNPQLYTKNKVLSFIIILFLSAFNINFLEFSYYGSNFRLFILSYLFLLIILYINGPNRKLLLLSFIIMSAHLSTHSTALFISVMLLILLFLYIVWFKKLQHFDFILAFSLPVLIYICSILYDIIGGLSFVFFIIFLGLYYLLYRLNKFGFSWWFLFLKIISFFIVSIIFIGSILMIISETKAPVMLTNFYQSFISVYYNGFSVKLIDIGQILVSTIIIILLITGFKKQDSYNILYFIPLGALILFFNPIVAPFISTFLTGIVYDRTIILIISITTIALAMAQLVQLKYNRLIIGGVFIISNVIFINDTVFNENVKLHTLDSLKAYDLLYKQPIDLIELDVFLNEYTEGKRADETRILSCDFRIRLQSRNHILVYTVPDYRELDLTLKLNEVNMANVYEAITRSLELELISKDMSFIYDILKSNQVNLLIVPNLISSNLEQSLQEYSQLVYKNNSYRVYEVNILK